MIIAYALKNYNNKVILKTVEVEQFLFIHLVWFQFTKSNKNFSPIYKMSAQQATLAS